MQDRKSETKAKETAGDSARIGSGKFLDARFNEENSIDLSAEEFANLGGGEVAYVATMRSEDVHRIFPNAPHIQAGIKIYALLAADGSPILLTDSHDAAVAGAWENELATVSVH